MSVSGGVAARMAEPFAEAQTPEARIAGVFSVWAVGRAVGDLAAAAGGNSTYHPTTDSKCHAETPISKASA